MNKKRIITVLLISVFIFQAIYLFCIPSVKASVIPPNYHQDLDTQSVYVYNVTEFGGDTSWYNFTPWPADSFEGTWRTNKGGQIRINITDFYDKDPNDWGNVFDNPIPYMDIEILENQSNILVTNFTLTNRSNSEVARQMTLGFNDFQSGFLIPNDNWTDVKEKADQEKTGAFANAHLTIEETFNFIYFGFEQTDGAQSTKMIYDRDTGLLVWARTTFMSYILEIESLNFTFNTDISYNYTVLDFGGDTAWYNFTPWPANSFEGYWKVNKTGFIMINFTGHYAKDPNDWGNVFDDPIPYLNISMILNNSGALTLNFTLANRSNSETARQLTLGFNDFQSGFRIPTSNLTDVKAKAEQEKTGPFANADLKIGETNLTIKITFDQTDGAQYTSMIYDKRTGQLLWAYTEFSNYKLEMKLVGYTPWEDPLDDDSEANDDDDDDDDDSTDDLSVPSFPIYSLMFIIISGLLIGTLYYKKKIAN